MRSTNQKNFYLFTIESSALQGNKTLLISKRFYALITEHECLGYCKFIDKFV